MSKDHYVSRFHLREFCDPTSLDKPDPWLWVGTLADNSVKRRSPKNVGTAPDLFAGPGGLSDSEMTIETFLANEVLELLPHFPVGGWGGWPYAIGSSMLLQNSGGENITVYCCFDSDYHSTLAITRRHEEASRNAVQLHIWSCKEIENHFLVSTALTRLVNKRVSARTQPVTESEIREQLDRICGQLKDETFDAISAELLGENRALGAGGANKEARKLLDQRWDSLAERLAVVSGKQAFSSLSEWTQKQFGVAVSASLAAREIDGSEVSQELRMVLSAIEKGVPFKNP